MQRFQPEADEIIKSNLGPDEVPVFSYDGASYHTSAEVQDALERMGITSEAGNVAPLPAKSPDMHKVVEHTFNNCDSQLRHIVLDDPGLSVVDPRYDYVTIVRDIMMNMSADWIVKDIQTLYDTYQHIIRIQGHKAKSPFN